LIEQFAVAWVPLASDAENVIVACPTTLGEPVIAPVDWFKVSAEGREPDTTEKFE
jgi:hypothetical protein